MNVNDDNIDDSKPSATDTISDTVAPSKSPAERNTMLSTKHHIGRNTREFAHALNHLSTEDLPSYAREHNSLLTFPEKFMLLMIYVERISSKVGRIMEQETIYWTKNGTVVVVRDPEDLYSTWLVKFFGSLKYDSFIRKLYRWGFRKSPPTTYDLHSNYHVFSHPCFCRDQVDQLCKMKSSTAVKRRVASKMPTAANPLNRSQTNELNAIQPADIRIQPNPLLSAADIQQHYLAPQIPNYASIIAQQLRSLQNEALLTESMLLQLQNSDTSAQDLLRFRMRPNQPLQPAVPSIQELVQLIRRQNANISLQSPSAALEELLRQLRQNPSR